MSLVNQMLRDLELRQSGQLAADGGVLCDIGAVHEPLADTGRGPTWRSIAVLLAIAGAAALLAAAPELHLPWSMAADDLRAPRETTPRFVSVVRPERSSNVAQASDHHPSAPPDSQAVVDAAAVAPTPAVWSGLRLERQLGAVSQLPISPAVNARDDDVGSVPASKPGKATLPAELGVVAARFDRAFAASLATNGSGAEDASPARTASTPLKVKTAVHLSAAERAQARYADAAAAFAAGERNDAERGLAQTLLEDPAHTDARQMLATVLLQSGRFGEADRLLAAAPMATPALAGLRARALVELGREAEALAVLEPSLEHSTDINQRAFHAALMQRLGDHVGASNAYRGLLDVQPDNGVWWMGLGISLEATNRSEEARNAFQRARSSGRLSQALVEFVDKRLTAL